MAHTGLFTSPGGRLTMPQTVDANEFLDVFVTREIEYVKAVRV